MKTRKTYLYLGLPVAGILFYLCYLHKAAIDVVYSDYIRLINSYLPDVWNPDKFFVPDVLTRIPVNYLERIINVGLFGYSVSFDRLLGVLGFGLSALLIGSYCRKQRIRTGWYVILMVIMFSLNKWEMLYNGTGWAHFLAFACFFYHYLVLDRVYKGREHRGDKIRLAVLPAVISLGIAGPYCAIYTVTLLLAYGFILVSDRLLERRKASRTVTGAQIAGFVFCAVCPFFLYLLSNSAAVYEYSGAAEGSMITAFFQEPEFFLKFFLKSFASMVFGVEFIERRLAAIPGVCWCIPGVMVLASYFLALWMNFYYGICEKTIFPLMLLAGGGMNHLMVLVSRWIFMPNDMYGMSSRYALQYQIGILGILLTFALAFGRGAKKSAKTGIRLLAFAVTAMFLLGNLATSAEEWNFAKHRKNSNIERREKLLNFEEMDEEELKAVLEYRKPGTKEALCILKENGWNIFREEK